LVGSRGDQDHDGEGFCLPQQGGFQARPHSNLSSKFFHPGNAPRQKFTVTLLSASPLGCSPHPCHSLQWRSCELPARLPMNSSIVHHSNSPPSPPWTLHHSSSGRCNEINGCRWLRCRWSQEETSGPSHWHLAWAQQQMKMLPIASSRLVPLPSQSPRPSSHPRDDIRTRDAQVLHWLIPIHRASAQT